MSQLGSYITNEYAVLLQIFSYLPAKCLHNAAQVCREWRKVASRVLMKRNKPVGYYKLSGGTWSVENFDDRIQPKVMLHFVSCYGSKNLGSEFYSTVSHVYNLDNVPVFDIRNGYLMASQYSDNNLNVKGRLGKNSEFFLAFCDMPGVKVNSFCFNLEHSSEQVKELVQSNLETNPKCMIIITGGCQGRHALAEYVLSLCSNQKNMVAAGGMAQKAIRSLPNTNKMEFSCLCLTLGGENLSVFAAVHQLKEDLEVFFKRMQKNVGPIPKGGLRLCLLFSCINRLEIYSCSEISLFSKYFPDVPVYGFWSYGEYMWKEAVNSYDIFLDPSTLGVLVECSSYLILTFKRDI